MKKLKKGTKVTLSKKYINWIMPKILEVYSIPSTGQISKDHHEELMVLFGHLEGFKVKGKVVGNGDDCYKVEFKSDLGNFDGYYEAKDLKEL